MGILQGKRALIVGVASNRSIAWGIARAMHREGAELAFTYQNDRLKDRVTKLAAELDSDIVLPLDVGSDSEIDNAFGQLKQHWDGLDCLVHAVAFAPREQLEGGYLENINREAFSAAHDISAYSFAALGAAARPMMQGRNAAMLTMTYLGAVRAIPNYNLMGIAKASLEANVRYMAADLGPENIRVNGISAGPIKTLAASGIGGFREILDYVEQRAPLRRNVTTDEVGNAAAFMCSDLASAITGEITYVDCGFSQIGF